MMNRQQTTENRKQRGKHRPVHCSRFTVRSRGFTLVETLVAISLLTLAIVAPITLTAQSLTTSYYARDQITAYYLAQEGIEVVRSVRDSNVLKDALGQQANLLDYNGTSLVSLSPFTVDTLQPVSSAITACGGVCPPLQTDASKSEYGYGLSSNTNFTRTVTACYIQGNGTCIASPATDEIRVAVTVAWTSGHIARTFTLSEDMYRWVNDGSGA